ncbi:MAG: hypothetical protein GY803_30560 [Chloroflexi bacterium]|nr:hypothetical protein [Chloroflexota bacterium]
MKRIGWQLWTVLAFWPWRFVGRVGLAVRNLLTWTIWRPLLWLLTPFRFLWRFAKKALAPVWRLLGRMGLALRQLLALLVWRPLGWLHRVLLRPFLALLARFFQARWEATAPQRRRLNRRWSSRWSVWRARWRVRLRRPKPPQTAVTAPRIIDRQARRMRWLTAVVSVGIVLAVSFITLQEQQPDRAAAGVVLTRIVEVTSTPGPVAPTPRPTIPVKLTPWATPNPLAGGGSLAFVQHNGGNSDIYILPIGQAEPARLTSHPAPDREPVWRPDGQEIAFSSRRDGNWELYVYNLPAGELRRVTNNLAFDGRPSWSPDGQWLAYESYRAENLDIFIVKADGGEGPFRLTENAALDYAPAWSPGGRHIAYISWRDGGPDLFTLSLDDVSDETAVNLAHTPDIYEANPVWSADGSSLAYSDDRAGFPLLYALPMHSNAQAAGPPASLGQQGRYPAWSPDGRSLVAVYSQDGQDYLVAGSRDGWGVTPQLLVGDGRLSHPDWSAAIITPALAQTISQIEPSNEVASLFVEAIAKTEAGEEGKEPRQLLWELPVNAPSPYLSDQVDQSFEALRQRVVVETDWDFLARLDHMFETIDSYSTPGQPTESGNQGSGNQSSGNQSSWNKAGRAFDFYYREALSFEPRVEVAREEMGTKTFWRVYVRTEAQDGSQGEPLRALPWDFQARYGDEPRYYDEGGKLKEAIPPGYYVDFTALAADYGWERVAAGADWRAYFPAINFWHFENRSELTWREAMLELYTEDEFTAVFGNP